MDLGQPRIDARHIDRLHIVEIAAGNEVADRRAPEVQEAHAQRLRKTCPRIIRRRAADAEDDFRDAPLDRIADQLAGAVGGGDERVALLLGNQRQAGGLRHLDHRRLAVAEEAVRSEHPGAHWTRDLDLDDLSAGRIDEGLHRAFAAVGHWHLDVGSIRPDPLQARLDLARDF